MKIYNKLGCVSTWLNLLSFKRLIRRYHVANVVYTARVFLDSWSLAIIINNKIPSVQSTLCCWVSCVANVIAICCCCRSCWATPQGRFWSARNSSTSTISTSPIILGMGMEVPCHLRAQPKWDKDKSVRNKDREKQYGKSTWAPVSTRKAQSRTLRFIAICDILYTLGFLFALSCCKHSLMMILISTGHDAPKSSRGGGVEIKMIHCWYRCFRRGSENAKKRARVLDLWRVFIRWTQVIFLH